MRLAAVQVLAPEIQAFLSGTMWSMSTSEAAVQVAPSYGENQVPDVAAQALSTTTLVPSRFRTYSLDTGRLVLLQCKKEKISAHRVLQVPLTVVQVVNRSREYCPSSTAALTVRAANWLLAVAAVGMPGYELASAALDNPRPMSMSQMDLQAWGPA